MTMPVLSLTVPELLHLAGAVGAETLIGVPDPFAGWLPDQVQESMQQARVRLAERGLCGRTPGGQLALDAGTAATVAVCSYPEVTLVLSQTLAGGAPTETYFHFTRAAAAELTAQPDGTYALTRYAGRDAVRARVIELLGLGSQAPAAGAAVAEVPASVLQEVREGKAPRRLLQQAGLPPETAEALSSSLEEPVANSALAVLRAASAQEAPGLGLLEGQNGLWLLQPVTKAGQLWVQLVPCSGADAAARVAELMANL